MDEIEDASGRISSLVAAVKQYSHMDAATHADVDLHPGIESTVVMLGHKLAGVRVVPEFDRTLPPVPAYAGELNQVWTNLIDNAADAMGGSGVLTLRTRRDGGFAVVDVADDGPGIPDEIRGRIFDAFFTTKQSGTGSGLGLDNARRIIEQRHGGSLEVTTSGEGTTFTARLPLERD
jgi:signal transduction histidine kinase